MCVCVAGVGGDGELSLHDCHEEGTGRERGWVYLKSTLQVPN